MRFNRHSDLKGKHAFLSPSTYSWLNYDDQKLEARFIAATASRKGQDLHDLAHKAINLRVTLADENQALTEYVNDAVAFGMVSEQPLFYSDNCFGTADSIGLTDGILRIHDLKTGITVAGEKQLEIYAALFCLEYSVDPYVIKFELRIYQRDEIRIFEPSSERIEFIMDKIVDSDHKLEAWKEANQRF